MGTATLDDRKLRGKSPSQRNSQGGAPSGKPRKKKGRGKMLVFLVWSVACAVGGIYFDRHLLPKTRIWFGEQVQTISGYGQEQTILGYIEDAGLSAADKSTAQANVKAVYERKRQGRLSADQVEQLGRAEVPFVHAASNGTSPSPQEVAQSLKMFAHLAGN